MRRIRSQSGVNLFKNLRDLTVAEKKAEKYYELDEPETAMMYENCGNALEFLQASLASHGAGTKQVLKQHG